MSKKHIQQMIKTSLMKQGIVGFTWHAVADSLLVKWDGQVPKLSDRILLPKNVPTHQSVVWVEVLAVGSVAREDVKVGDKALTRVEALAPVEGDVWRLGAGLVLGIKREGGGK